MWRSKPAELPRDIFIFSGNNLLIDVNTTEMFLVNNNERIAFVGVDSDS